MRMPMAMLKCFLKMRLLLIRHGKSSWDIPGQPDQERPLAIRGHKQLKELAILLHQAHFKPDRIVVSPAVRTQLTAAVLRQCGWGDDVVTQTRHELYENSADEINLLIRKLISDCEFLVIIGHNPWMNELIGLYTGVTIENLKTSGAVLLEFEHDQQLKAGTAKLAWSHRLSY